MVFASDYGGDERTDIFMVPATGGEVEKITVSTQAEGSPRFSQDGKRLAYLADPVQAFQFQLFAMDLSSRVVTQLTRESVTVKSPVWAPDGKVIAVVRTGDDQKGELLLVDTFLSSEPRVINPPAPVTVAEQTVCADPLYTTVGVQLTTVVVAAGVIAKVALPVLLLWLLSPA